MRDDADWVAISWRGISSIVHTYMGCQSGMNLRQKDRGTYVSMVTALFGTVLSKFTLSPLYNPDQPSLITIFFAVYTTPRRECRFTIPSDDMSSDSGRFCVCNRVRTTSCGYVAIEAVIFAIAEQRRIARGASGTSERPSEITYRWVRIACSRRPQRTDSRAHIFSCS